MDNTTKPARAGYEWRTCPRCNGAKFVPDTLYNGPDKPCGFCDGKGEYEQCVDGSDYVGGA